jgi:hypothetical protein
MARDYVVIGSVPYDEPAVQVGRDNYNNDSILECYAFIEQIRRKIGIEPEDAKLKDKAFSHDFGAYRQVVCCYDDTDAESTSYAFECENHAPDKWDDEAIAWLKENGYTLLRAQSEPLPQGVNDGNSR